MNKSVDKKPDANSPEESENGFKENVRYKRSYLKPMVKSVYHPRMIKRLNGSLTTSIRSPGLTHYESFRGEHRDNMQIDMTQTFHMNILNNSLAQMKQRIGGQSKTL